MKLVKLSSVLLFGVLTLAACKKKGCTDPNAENYSSEAEKDNGSCVFSEEMETGSITIELSHVWGMTQNPFELGTELIHPMTNDTLNFSKLKYYIGNVQLKSSDGTWWAHPESYFLVDASDAATGNLEISGIPSGTYSELSYVLGVDSVRNVSGAQTGALSTVNGMFWSWNTGYIMVKAEGTSPNSSTGQFSYHLGGFSGANNIVTTKSTVLSEPIIINSSSEPRILMHANVARLFHYYGSVANGAMIHMPGANAVTLADGFYDGFNVYGIVQ